jgi:rhodanese-related sulfurtransferase
MSLRILPSAIATALALTAFCAAPPLLAQTAPAAATAGAAQPQAGWYTAIVDTAFVRSQVDIPPRKGVLLIDSRPAARRYDVGHIPGSINIPDTQFDKFASRLPADKSTLLVFYCGGFDCLLSHHSAFKAEKLGYSNIKVYAAGMPAWTAVGGQEAVSLAHVLKLAADKTPHLLVDSRPRRVASKGMIPGAVNIPDSEFDKLTGQLPADKATPLIFYCGGLDCVLSDKSATKARALGYTAVRTYPEGYPEWAATQGQAQAAAAAAAPAAAAMPAVALVPGKEKGSVTVDSFQQVWRAQPASVMLIDVRDAKEFANGAITGAVNLPINELEKQIATLPLDKPVVFICGTGARSGEAYDMVKLYRAEVQAFFIDAEAKFMADGSYTMTKR